MKSVEILLREAVTDLGRPGDVVRVAAGYARNYLLPRRIAVAATEENKRVMVKRRAIYDAQEAAKAEEVAKAVAKLSELMLETKQRCDEQGHLYGSVSASQIIELLAGAGYVFEEKAIRIGAPIKTVDTHVFQVHVHGESYAEVRIQVAAEATADAS